MSVRLPQVVVQTDWLDAHLSDEDLRVFDCTVYLHPAPPDAATPYRVESGRADYLRGHIPGAGFLDVPGELSDPDTQLHFMRPSAEQFAAAMARHGVGEGTRVVLYSAGSPMWATRVWWMLRAFGFDEAAVLDGGWDKWVAEGRATATAACAYPPATFVPRPRPGLFVDKAAVRAAIDDDAALLMNALSPALHSGAGWSRYGRPGRIPGSVNVWAKDLLDPETQTFVPLAAAKDRLEAAGAAQAERIVLYCGGGISATVNALLLHRLGYENCAVYDGSMGEWAPDEALPIERDEALPIETD